uniref:F-box/LRR-repeat protein 15/At3g58940/PEG3-like LRR domain-containing protein n=1 Tax=Oryza glumipatula TaxID=40148 RepID=A0A0D9Y889_9ORYZ
MATKYITLSEVALHAIIIACPLLETLLLEHIYGFHCVRISSPRLRASELNFTLFISTLSPDKLALPEVLIGSQSPSSANETGVAGTRSALPMHAAHGLGPHRRPARGGLLLLAVTATILLALCHTRHGQTAEDENKDEAGSAPIAVAADRSRRWRGERGGRMPPPAGHLPSAQI